MTALISIAILTHNETQEFQWLMKSLESAKSIIAEIVIVDDYSQPEFVSLVKSYSADWPIKFFQRRLNKNFAAQRNFAKSKCNGRLILSPDADEIPSARTLQILPNLLSWMEDHEIDACYLPRVNVVLDKPSVPDPTSFTFEDFEHYWEDQIRILRNLPNLRWVKRIDEGLAGVKRAYKFPRTNEFAMLHAKTRNRIAHQNTIYRSMRAIRFFAKIGNSIAKRTIRRQRVDFLAATPPF